MAVCFHFVCFVGFLSFSGEKKKNRMLSTLTRIYVFVCAREFERNKAIGVQNCQDHPLALRLTTEYKNRVCLF